MNLDEFKYHVNNIRQETLDDLKQIVLRHKKIILIGNGGSNAIASHLANDYTKTLKRQAMSFSDSSRLTCYVNDYGSDFAYARFIEDFASESLVILISSSGNSKNILEAAKKCKEKSLPFIILTGFDKDNLLKKQYENDAAMSIWIDSKSYAIVECLHEAYLHGIVDV